MNWVLIVLFVSTYGPGSRAATTIEFKHFDECKAAAAQIQAGNTEGTARAWCVQRSQ